MGLNLQYNPFLARSSILIFLSTSVFLRHLIDVPFGFRSSYLFDDATANHYELVRVPLLRNRESNLRILLDVSVFHATDCCVDEHMVSVRIDPCGSDLRRAVGIYGG